MGVKGEDFYDPEDIKNLLATHLRENSVVTLMTSRIENPVGYGRIVRENGEITEIVEEKLATEEQKQINEVNTGFWVFKFSWIHDAINRVKVNSAGEYYLTDLLEIAVFDRVKVSSYQMNNPAHLFGVNNPDQLDRANKKLANG